MASRHGVSTNALARVLALQSAAIRAGQQMQLAETYNDFFVEAPDGGSWHEAFGDSGPGEVEFTAARMALLDGVILAGDGYSDFLVEAPDGGSWHEAFGDSGPGEVEQLGNLVTSVGARVSALSSVSVIQAYARLKATDISG
jgi:hypothetical protein